MKSIVVLISGNGSNLQALIDAKKQGKITANITGVISNQSQAYGLVRAKNAGIPSEVLSHTDYETREAFDDALQTCLLRYAPDLVVLAGFMRKLTSNFVHCFENRLINIHPALLPKFRGLQTHERALAAGETEHGISIHYVSEVLDGGPIIAQAKCQIDDKEDVTSLQKKVQQLEHQYYPIVIEKILTGEIYCLENQVYYQDIPLSNTGMLLN